MSSKAEKERTKQIQDKCQRLLDEMLKDDDNKYCVDCDAKGNVSLIFATFRPNISLDNPYRCAITVLQDPDGLLGISEYFYAYDALVSTAN